MNKWKEIKPGRIAWGNYAIVTLPKGSSHKYVVYNSGRVIGFGDGLTATKKICKACEEEDA